MDWTGGGCGWDGKIFDGTGGGCGWDGKIFDGTGKFWIGRTGGGCGCGCDGKILDGKGCGCGWEEINQSKVRRDAFFTLHIIHVGIKGMS